ncbi:MAG: transcription elongation factor GreA [Candidatus Harrisonbacteria bacterium CG10_big_fil_rev_8_21_14_0_10_49_15]|uniref:Transcription elongation factor GreA n=1 Tax=Candidatus Harrisonbacteria bacterium CG10_big_fil_rev_8_21_14_0_10_49_15 TaxID=1974587 RepID=A0A2H0ULF4_9BACT|nr:MAG: transcription elongation factor GreA [Candidatus Harrisonbacteria bacterium CG10_big_fil_rev_8_21_14_0_10_49_15]
MDHYITQQKLEQLTQELEEYRTTKRQEVARRLKRAKELGDLSENSEYFEAREQQQRVEGRILELEDILRNAQIIEMTHGAKTIQLGGTLTTSKNGNKVKFTIVGADEVNPEEGYISNESPLGQAFLGKAVGDKVTVATPGGKSIYTIESID